MELTAKRKIIFETVNNCSKPVSARQVFDESAHAINLATVYRGLEFLSRNDMIESFTLDCRENGTVKYYYRKTEPHSHFFHCIKCHVFIPVHTCSVEKDARNFEKENNCHISSHVLYFMGICGKCG